MIAHPYIHRKWITRCVIAATAVIAAALFYGWLADIQMAELEKVPADYSYPLDTP